MQQPTKIKICGMTRREDIETAVSLGVDALGFILARSSRQVTLDQAGKLTAELPPFIARVAVVVNPVQARLAEIVASRIFTAIQFHGSEDPATFRDIPLKTIKAISITDQSDLEEIGRYQGQADHLLFDTKIGNQIGGTGKSFDWSLLASRELNQNYILAGGLGPANIREALDRLKPVAVDLNSRLETAPGRKDPELIRKTVNIIKNYNERSNTMTEKYFSEFGGRYVSETLIPALDELSETYQAIKDDSYFKEEYKSLLADYCGRPTPLYFAEKLTEYYQGPEIYLKREDLNHTGAHKINNTLGQILLAKKMGKERIIAETGAGQHGVATATVAARFDLDCDVYMGAEDIKRQALNVYKMEMLGAQVIPVNTGSKTLKDATNQAIRDWVSNVESTHYIIGSVVGPYPYPEMVRDFQKIIGEETKKQITDKKGKLPDYILACVGGGSNAIGIFHPFIADQDVNLIGIEAAGEGIDTGRHAATLSQGRVGVLHGSKSYLLQDQDGQVIPAHSISAGLDYPGVGPEHSHLKAINRVRYDYIDDQEAIQAFRLLSEKEGIIPALESSHALAYLEKLTPELSQDQTIVVNLSGRGDKDINNFKKIREAEADEQN